MTTTNKNESAAIKGSLLKKSTNAHHQSISTTMKVVNKLKIFGIEDQQEARTAEKPRADLMKEGVPVDENHNNGANHEREDKIPPPDEESHDEESQEDSIIPQRPPGAVAVHGPAGLLASSDLITDLEPGTVNVGDPDPGYDIQAEAYPVEEPVSAKGLPLHQTRNLCLLASVFIVVGLAIGLPLGLLERNGRLSYSSPIHPLVAMVSRRIHLEP